MPKFTYNFFCKNIVVIFFALLCFFSCKEEAGPYTDLVQFPRISAQDATISESEGVLLANVKLSWAYDTEVKVNYIIKQYDGDLVSAEENLDFEAQSGTLTFPVGETEQSITVNIVNDVVAEPDEQFELVLSDPVYGKLITTTGILTIKNDDEGLAVDDTGPDSPETYLGYELVWEDQFDGDAIDPECWTHEIGGHGWGNNELEYYTDRPTNSFTSSGYLVIEAKEEQIGNNPFTSARMITAGKKEFQYGRIDIRAKLPKGRGIWPALWMLGRNFYDDGWPSCGEIDIMELVGHQPSIVYGTAHYGANPAEHAFQGGTSFLPGQSFSDEFHVYSIIWKENSIQWLRDGVQYYDLTPADLGGAAWPFNNSFFFIFNVAVGGDWPGNPDATTVFPQRMIVDYIRVFQ